MAEPNDLQKHSSVDEEWSKILGQTDAFLGHVKSLTQASATEVSNRAPIEEAAEPSPSEEGDTAFVSAFPRSSQLLAITFHIEGRALSRARAAYQELTGFRLRVLSLSSAKPEIVFDEPMALPGKAELEIELPHRCAFVLVAVGVLDGQGEFKPIAHAAPVALSPAMSYPKEPPPPIFVDTQTDNPVRPPQTPQLPHIEDPETFSSW